MTDADERVERARLDRAVDRGAAVNFLGTLGKALVPAFFILITQVFGPEIMGVFLLAYVALDVVSGLTVSGVNDGVLMFASRVVEDPDRKDELYAILANGFVLSGVIAALLIALSVVGGPAIIDAVYPGQPELVPALRIMILSLPFYLFAIIVIAATKSLLVMTWDALLIGFLRPLGLLGFAVVAAFASRSVTGLAWAYFAASVLLGVASVFVFARYFSFRALWRHVVHFRLSWPLIKFSVPQNLNLTFNQFITNLDVMMLGAFRFDPAIIGYYGMGAQIANNVRLIRLGFSGAFAPVITRLHARGATAELSRGFTRVSRAATTLALPVVIAIAIHRDDLLWLFHPSFRDDASFVLLLLAVPLISCACGTAGNIIVMTGHSLWNLLNSFLVTGLNFVLNLLLIPPYGLMGAALATFISSTVVAILQLIEVQALVSAHLDPKRVLAPLLAALPAAGIGVGFVALGLDTSVWARVGATALALGAYAAAGVALGVIPLPSRRPGRGPHGDLPTAP